MADDKKIRETKTPTQKLADLDNALEGAQLKREEIDANIATLNVRRKRLIQANPELVNTDDESE